MYSVSCRSKKFAGFVDVATDKQFSGLHYIYRYIHMFVN